MDEIEMLLRSINAPGLGTIGGTTYPDELEDWDIAPVRPTLTRLSHNW